MLIHFVNFLFITFALRNQRCYFKLCGTEHHPHSVKYNLMKIFHFALCIASHGVPSRHALQFCILHFALCIIICFANCFTLFRSSNMCKAYTVQFLSPLLFPQDSGIQERQSGIYRILSLAFFCLVRCLHRCTRQDA